MPYIYPQNYEMREIEPELIRLGLEGRVGLQIAPIQRSNSAKVRWRQRDIYRGMQNMRGYDGSPVRVNRPGSKWYEYNPGVFGDFIIIDEQELTERAGPGVNVATTPIDVEDLTMESDSVLVGRELDRMEWAVWTLLTTGTISINLPGDDGQTVGWTATYTLQTFTAGVSWSTFATATPIIDLQTIAQGGSPAGRSVSFGAGSVAYMNSFTANLLLNNSNAADLGGRRIGGGSTLNTLQNIRDFLIGQNLPTIAVYDNGYVDDYGTYNKFIPNKKVVVVGQRANNATIAAYMVTRNANANFAPQSYRYVVDRINGTNAEKRTPPNIEIHRGHNGGPVMFYPSAIFVMSV
jgi:hypothetical protein